METITPFLFTQSLVAIQPIFFGAQIPFFLIQYYWTISASMIDCLGLDYWGSENLDGDHLEQQIRRVSAGRGLTR
jgi:hypothetical protein